MSGGKFNFTGGKREEVPEGKHIAAMYKIVTGRSQKGNDWVSLRFRLIQHNRQTKDGDTYHPGCGAFLILYEANEENVGIARDSLDLQRITLSEAASEDAWKAALGIPVLVDIVHREYQDRDGRDRISYDVMGMYPYNEDSEMFTADILPGQVCIEPEWQEPPPEQQSAGASSEPIPF